MNLTIATLTFDEIDGLLDLQQQNLKINLTDSEIAQQGFVTFVYTPQDMADMMAEAPQIVVKHNDLIVGYALVVTQRYAATNASLNAVLQLVNTLEYQDRPLKGEAFYFVGQVCVRKGYRGMGIFDKLYAGHRSLLAAQYDYTITEVAVENARSMAAHHRVGFETIHQYNDGIAWDIILMNTKQ